MIHEELIDANESNDAGPEVKSYGEYLRLAREALGFSIDEVAIELHLARDIIVHMEQEALASLPDPIFVRGYLRSYAKLVQADPNQVIAAFNVVCAPIEHKKFNPSKHIVIKEMKSGGERPMRWVSYIIFVGLVVLLLVWWHSHSSQNVTADNGTIAALATLKPVADGSVSSTVAVGSALGSGGTTGPGTVGAATNTMTTTNTVIGTSPAVAAAAGTTADQTAVHSPNDIVNTGIQNLAPSTNTLGSAAATSSPATQTLANTPTPVVNSTSPSSTPAAASPAKPKAAASTWRNPDLE